MIKILRKIKHVLSGKKTAPVDEDKYYTRLFTQSAEWNKPTPNDLEQQRWDIIERYVQKAVATIKNQDHTDKPAILDLGCGRGWLCNLLSAYGVITGIEPVKDVVAFGKSLFPALNLQSGTAKDLLSKPDYQRYDLIVSSEVIEHIPDNEKENFIKDIASLLKKNGFVILTTPRKEAQAEWLKHSSPNQPVEDWITEKDLKALLQKMGFAAVDLSRLSEKPAKTSPLVEVYQLWLFQQQ